MSPKRWNRVKELFHSAIEREGSARAAFLGGACPDDGELRTQVEALIAAHESDPTFLEQPVACTPTQLSNALGPGPQCHDILESSTDTRTDAPSGSPKRIGQYRIDRLIASGGMGAVYEATQENPSRTVAIKLMRHGIASRSALRRFEYESHILARLRHHGIAQVYEAGTHEDDGGTTPFFAMEYIPTAMPITRYAKENKLGTRHRIELFLQVCAAVHHGHQKGIIHRDLKPSNILVDAHGQVKIIDFGVARCTDSDLAITTLQTDVGQLIGTLQYMSPEQCEADPHDIDTRSDVYALGVVLYELLTDRLPYDVSRKPIHEAARLIREEQPTKLSTISRALRGDAETIVCKALEKDRDRRYQSASALMADIGRYLNNQPISARPASAIYQFQKLVMRHKVPFTLLALMFVFITGLAAAMSVMYVRATQAERRAATDAAKASSVSEFLQTMLRSVDPDVAQGQDTPVLGQLLDGAAARVSVELADQPEVEAAVRSTIGRTYLAIGRVKEAEEHTRAALEIYRRLFGEEHESIASALHDLSQVLHLKGDFAEAEQAAERAVEMRRRLFGDEHNSVAESLQSLGQINIELGRFDRAEVMLRQAMEINRKSIPRNNRLLAESIGLLARAVGSRRAPGDLRAAIPLARESVQIFRQIYGDAHLRVVDASLNLGMLLYYDQQYSEAEPILRRGLERARRLLGEEHSTTITAMNNLADCLSLSGKYNEAIPLFHETLEVARRQLGEEHTGVALLLLNLAGAYTGSGDHANAVRFLREGLAIFRKNVDKDHPYIPNILYNLATNLNAMRDYAAAEPVWRDVLERRRKSATEGKKAAWYLGRAERGLGDCLVGLGRYGEAETLLLEGHRRLQDLGGETDEDAIAALQSLIGLYDVWGKPARAAQMRASLTKAGATSATREPESPGS